LRWQNRMQVPSKHGVVPCIFPRSGNTYGNNQSNGKCLPVRRKPRSSSGAWACVFRGPLVLWCGLVIVPVTSGLLAWDFCWPVGPRCRWSRASTATLLPASLSATATFRCGDSVAPQGHEGAVVHLTVRVHLLVLFVVRGHFVRSSQSRRGRAVVHESMRGSVIGHLLEHSCQQRPLQSCQQSVASGAAISSPNASL
jgi:hypothetical protein